MTYSGLKAAALAAAAAAALALSACGGDDESSTTTDGGGSSTPAATESKLKGEPIVVGMVCSCTGPQASALGRADEVAKAWAASVNAGDGINGHPVKLIVKDDGGTPAKSVAAVKELVEKDGIVAIVGQVSNADQAWETYVEGKGIPVVGGIAEEAPFLTSADFYTSGTQLPVSVVAQAQLAKARGKKSLGILYCAESPACAQLETLGKAAAGLAGLKLKTGKISGTAPDYTAQCLAMKNAGVDTLYVANASAVSLRVVDSCAQQGYKPLYVSEATTSGPEWLDNPNVDGAFLVNPNGPYMDASIPAIKEFQDAVDQYSPGIRDSPEFGFAAFFPWVGGKLFERAATEAKLTPDSTAADVKRGLYALKGETLGGIAPPLTYTKGQPTLAQCYFVTSVADGKFKSENGGKASCLSDEQFGALAKGLAAGR